jgi:Flp pilus assembly protein TadG
MKKHERGQVMILVVFGIVGFVVIAGLAIDGGRLHAQRRQVQNASDAAALAGARAVLNARIEKQCNNSGISLSALDSAVAQTLLDFAQSNDVDYDAVGDVPAWYVDADGAALERVGADQLDQNELENTVGVSVTLALTESTTFMRLVGRNTMVAGGKASAMFGPVTQMGGGMLPIGLPVQEVDNILASGNLGFTMFDGSGAICRQDGVDCPSDPSDAASRGWLNFNYVFNGVINAGGSLSHTQNRVVSTKMSNADVKDWAENGYQEPLFAGTRGGLPPYYTNGDFVVGDPGARESSRKTVCDNWMDKTVYLPVFDYVYQKDLMQQAFPTDEPASPLAFPAGQFLYYHIVGFTAATVDSCASHEIHGTFQYATISEGEINPAALTGSGSEANLCGVTVHGLSLWQ